MAKSHLAKTRTTESYTVTVSTVSSKYYALLPLTNILLQCVYSLYFPVLPCLFPSPQQQQPPSVFLNVISVHQSQWQNEWTMMTSVSVPHQFMSTLMSVCFISRLQPPASVWVKLLQHLNDKTIRNPLVTVWQGRFPQRSIMSEWVL